MPSIKVSILGNDTFTSQMPRIREAFQSLGNIISEESPDLIYSNDPTGYPKAIYLKKRFPNSYLILNFLDIPWHIPNVEKQTKLLVENFFNVADMTTTISFKVKKDLKKFLQKDIEVIYNPIKDVFHDKNIKKNNTFLYVGRANDKIKRINLVKESLEKIDNSMSSLKICGSEDPGFGEYLGIVSDEKLNELYNSSKYLYLPSKAEGLGLTMIEAMICGSLPIACDDNETAKEFLPEDFICKPDSQSIVKKINDLDKDYDSKRMLALDYGKKYKIQFDKISIAKNILNIFNSNKKIKS
jgi:hypothetical protein